MAPLFSHFASPGSLRKLYVDASGDCAKNLLLALKKDRSLVHLTIGPLTNKPSLATLVDLLRIHPMTSLELDIGVDLAKPETIELILKAVAGSRTLNTVLLHSRRDVEPGLEAVIGAFDLEASSLRDLTVNFGTWSLHRRSLKW